MDVLEGVVKSFSAEQKREAQNLETKIEEVTRVILNEKKSLDSNFVRLSKLIDEVRQKKYWLLGNYRTFGDYLADVEKKFNVGSSQLYVGMKITRNLLPTLPEEDLVEMGITKAGVLSKFIEQSRQEKIPEEILSVARDPKKTKEELDALVNSKLHNVLPEEKGHWFDLKGFYADESEREEILQALDLAASIDPIIPNNIPSWQQLKEKILRLSREFLSTYS